MTNEERIEQMKQALAASTMVQENTARMATPPQAPVKPMTPTEEPRVLTTPITPLE